MSISVAAPALDVSLLMACTGCTALLAEKYLDSFNEVLPLYELNTVNRAGMFLANVGHESMQLRYREELWGDPPTPAQSRYDTRKDLGNLYLGDGFKYRGRGWLQTTGRGNYQALTRRLRGHWPNMQVPDFVAEPDMLAQPEWACLSAGDFWDMQRISSRAADADNFDAACDLINLGHVTASLGDSNGYKQRLALWMQAKPALLLAGFPT